MSKEQELKATQRRERRIDEALKETFPASDTPSFVGAGAPTGDKERLDQPQTAAEMAGEVIDQNTDPSASTDEQESRKRKLVKGPKEFREMRRDRPRAKR